METTKTEAKIEAAKRVIAHWQAEKDATLAQIESGKYPQYEVHCRAYIEQCDRYIKLHADRAGLTP